MDDVRPEPSWTIEMVVAYCANLHEVSKGDRLKLLELVQPSHTEKLLAAVRAIQGSVSLPPSLVVHASIEAKVIEPSTEPKKRRGEWIERAEELLSGEPMTARQLAGMLGENLHHSEAKTCYYVQTGRIIVVSKIPRHRAKAINVYGLPGVTYKEIPSVSATKQPQNSPTAEAS
jgi:hypothetical protein